MVRRRGFLQVVAGALEGSGNFLPGEDLGEGSELIASEVAREEGRNAGKDENEMGV